MIQSNMSRGLLWLSILVLCFQHGNCYVAGDVEYFHTEQDVTPTCSIDDLQLEPTEDILQCFPEHSTDMQGIVQDGTTCMISQDVKVNTAPSRNELALRQCVNGHWTIESIGPKKTFHKRFFFVALVAAVAGYVACKYLCTGSSSSNQAQSPPASPPSYIDEPCKPASLQHTYYVESGETSVYVSWQDPAVLNDDGSVKSNVKTSGPEPGSAMEGSPGDGRMYHVSYKATSNQGLTAFCYFDFTVIVRTCSPAPWPTNGQRTCTLGAYLGSVCTFTCNSGYAMSGDSRITCQGSPVPDWTTPPTCGNSVCSAPPSLENGNVVCSSPTYEQGSACSLTCNDNYTLSGDTSYIQCQANGTWTSDNSQTCTDAFPPTLTCLTPQTFYTDRRSNASSVEWLLPVAADTLDTNATLTQTEGPDYGSVLSVGTTIVKYKATDSEGNESPECTIEIRVLETTCQHPLDTFNDTYMVYSCSPSTSYIFGTECNLTCNFNIPLAGADTITCERNDSNPNIAFGYWSWGNDTMPLCNHTDCPSLSPPLNGALTEDYFGAVKTVTMSCYSQYDIPPVSSGFSGQFVCQNSGNYNPNIDVPDCSETRNPRFNVLPSELFYYDGDCNNVTVQEQIKSNVQGILATTVNPLIQELCADVNNCTASNLKVICGPTTSRRRRSAGRSTEDDAWMTHDLWKRQTNPTMSITFDIIASLDQTLSFNEAIANIDSIMINSVVPEFEQLVTDGEFDVASFTLQSDSLQVPQYGDIGCEDGEVFSAASLSCLPCPAAYFLNETGLCEICPIGFYSDEAGLTSCKSCPTGYTTLKTGSKSESQCIEKCPLGMYSTTGTIPCSPCPIGYYQSGTGQTSCTKCTTGTTELTGSVSSTACQAFHVLLDGTNGEVTVGSVSTAMSNVSLTVWTKLYNPGTADASMRFQSDGSDRIVIHLTNTIRIEVPGTSIDTTLGYLSSDTWSHITVTLDTANNEASVYVDGELQSSESYTTAPSVPLVSGGAIDLKSTGNTGVYIADLHLEDTVLSQEDISAITTSCWTERPDAVFTLNDLREANVQGVKLQTPLACDPVDECKTNPCNSHTCVNGINTYTCYCSGGWSGINCTTPPNYCVNHGCANGASCVNGDTGYTCSCLPLYSGTLCDIEQVDGGWSEWSSWTDCPVSCDGSTQTRTRSCDNPFPSTDGANCTGDTMETQACNTESCPECPTLERSFRGTTNCSLNDATGLSTCWIKCVDNYVLPPSFEDMTYTCGISTNYSWAPNDNPPDCVKPGAPSRYELRSAYQYDTSITASDVQELQEVVTDNVANNVQCVPAGMCQSNIEVITDRRKRSTGSTIVVTLTVDLIETDDLDIEGFFASNTTSASLQELIDAINNLEGAATYINTSASSLFDVTVNGVSYSSSQSALTITGTVTCPTGMPTDGVCASCPAGSYYSNGYCTFCDKGTYSSSDGQTSCAVCPSGYTTTTIGSYNVSQCNVEDPTTTTVSTPTTTPTTTNAATTTSSTTTASTVTTPTTTPTTTNAATTTPSTTTATTVSTPTTTPITTNAATTTTSTTTASTTTTATTTNTPTTTTITTTQVSSSTVAATNPAPSGTGKTTNNPTTTTLISSSTTNSPTTENKEKGNTAMFIGIGVAVVALIVSIGVCGFVIYRKNAVKHARRVNSAGPVYHPPPNPIRGNSTVTVTDVEIYNKGRHDIDTYLTKPKFMHDRTSMEQMPQRNKFSITTNSDYVNSARRAGIWTVSPPPPYFE